VEVLFFYRLRWLRKADERLYTSEPNSGFQGKVAFAAIKRTDAAGVDKADSTVF
jgi:hypothetical protein